MISSMLVSGVSGSRAAALFSDLYIILYISWMILIEKLIKAKSGCAYIFETY